MKKKPARKRKAVAVTAYGVTITKEQADALERYYREHGADVVALRARCADTEARLDEVDRLRPIHVAEVNRAYDLAAECRDRLNAPGPLRRAWRRVFG